MLGQAKNFRHMSAIHTEDIQLPTRSVCLSDRSTDGSYNMIDQPTLPTDRLTEITSYYNFHRSVADSTAETGDRQEKTKSECLELVEATKKEMTSDCTNGSISDDNVYVQPR